jgi:hypothetical protein
MSYRNDNFKNNQETVLNIFKRLHDVAFSFFIFHFYELIPFSEFQQ